MTMGSHAALALLASAAAIGTLSAPAYAAQDEQHDYDLAAQPLADALRRVALSAGRSVAAPSELLQGKMAPPLKGRYRFRDAVAALLRDSGLTARVVGKGLVIEATGQAGSDRDTPPPPPSPDEVIVTGTRVHGSGPIGSTVTVIDRQAIDRSGYATTQDIAQTIPQNFGGSPNEGAGAGSFNSDSGFNTAAGSSLNLRGLGTGSTLVLLNGDRPPLGGFSGVFSDISLIPASAIERIEIVADGASAIYGSDAVAGVVNIIPRLNVSAPRPGFASAPPTATPRMRSQANCSARVGRAATSRSPMNIIAGRGSPPPIALMQPTIFVPMAAPIIGRAMPIRGRSSPPTAKASPFRAARPGAT